MLKFWYTQAQKIEYTVFYLVLNSKYSCLYKCTVNYCKNGMLLHHTKRMLCYLFFTFNGKILDAVCCDKGFEICTDNFKMQQVAKRTWLYDQN